MKNKNKRWWKSGGNFLKMLLGILSGPRVLLLARFLRHTSYVLRSKYVWRGMCGLPLESSVKPSISYHGYCRTPHLQCGGWSGVKWQVGTVGRLLMDY